MTIRWRRAIRWCDRGATALLVGAVDVYRRAVSPLLGRHCRFEPSCSSYFRQAVLKYGAWAGFVRGVRRLCRCHPWHPGGYDPP